MSINIQNRRAGSDALFASKNGSDPFSTMGVSDPFRRANTKNGSDPFSTMGDSGSDAFYASENGSDPFRAMGDFRPRPRSKSRRGITLLFVISLIVLFLLMGAAFVTISGNFKRVSGATGSLEVRGNSPRTDVDRALTDFLRGTSNTNSPLEKKNLLADMYAEGFKGTVAGVSTVPAGPDPVFDANNQLIRLALNVTPPNPTDYDKVGAYGGQVLTFISNTSNASVKGISCRIFHYDVQYDAAGAVTGRSFVIVPEWTNGQNPFANPANLVGANVLINGRAFADTGASPTSEPYDAIDENNSYLAAIDFENGSKIYPSFYHFSGATYQDRAANLPVLQTNASGVEIYDVDNDKDFIPDSVWVDPGYPVQSDRFGRQYKTLVAYLVLDLDPRYNLNANGNGEDAVGRYTNSPSIDPFLGLPTQVSQGQGYGPSEISMRGLFDASFPDPEYVNLFAGNGTIYGRFGAPGPAGKYGAGESEVRDPWSNYKLFGYPTSGIGNLYGSRMDTKGRYGWGFKAILDVTGTLPISMPGIDVVAAFDDGMLNPFPYNYDLVDCPFETNFAGYPYAGPSVNPVIAGGSTQPDHLFSPKELERVYRMFDADSKFLADRLLTLAPLTLGNPNNRLRVATEGYEVPVPPANSAVKLGTLINDAAVLLGVPPAGLMDVDTMLSPEILQGLKMDPNRPFGNGVDDNGDFAIDEYFTDGRVDEANSVLYPSGANIFLDISRNGNAPDNLFLARVNFAKHLYVLARLWLRGAGDLDADGDNIDIDAADRVALAQWCINVVDFRDSDAIMTPFEFDDDPFDGWNLDGWVEWNPGPDMAWGVLGVDDDINGFVDDYGDAGWAGSDDTNDMSHPQRRLVWGCERPELLITETMAEHDLRTEDTAEGGTFVGGDILHADNRLRPEASVFIELYAPWVAGNDVTYPSELYQANAVDLSRTANGDPVWRIAIAGPDANDDEYIDPSVTIPADPLLVDNRNRDPDDETIPATIDRVAYFVPPPAVLFPGNQGAEAFHATTGPISLPVGQHAVLGSSGNVVGTNTTTFGRRILDAAGLPVVEGDAAVIADTRSITLDTVSGQVRIRDFHVSTGSMISLTRNAIPIPVEFPVAAGAPQRPFNVSDRTGGYPIVDFLGVPAVQTVDGWIYTAPYDVPLDFVGRASTDYEFRSLRDDKTTPTYRVVHLQRLANPLAAWHAVINPYRTVDSLSMNLTAFNGISPAKDISASGPRQKDDPLLPNYEVSETVRDFASMERGRNRKYSPSSLFDSIASDINEHRILWSQDGINTGGSARRGNLIRSPSPILVNEINSAGNAGWHLSHEPATPLADTDQHIFNSTVFETLGTFNDAWFDHWQGVGGFPLWPINNATPTNQPSRDANFAPPGFDPAPTLLGLDVNKPFTWLTWNNRPYVSQYELMLVPTKSSSRLLQSFSAKAVNNPFGIGASGFVGTGFSHLPNFFFDELSFDPDDLGPLPPITVRGKLNKLLDFVEVPSRYDGTERYFLPDPPLNSALPQFEAVFGDLAAPFNTISRFRTPGKPNVNTVFDPDLWAGTIGKYADAIPAPAGPYLDYDVMDDSRRNSGPDEFVHPFREYSYVAAGINPMNNPGLLRGKWNKGTDLEWGIAGVDDDMNLIVDDPKEAGYLGSDDFVDDALLDYDPVSGQQAHNNSDRNAYFRYDAIQRMGNLVTTRSSVFAIWITVGYFEVDPATGDLMANAQELGADSGQITRHRGFFIFDRSIPVAFEKGVDHNIERGILVQSYIE